MVDGTCLSSISQKTIYCLYVNNTSYEISSGYHTWNHKNIIIDDASVANPQKRSGWLTVKWRKISFGYFFFLLCPNVLEFRRGHELATELNIISERCFVGFTL